jgi:hypothetical protein
VQYDVGQRELVPYFILKRSRSSTSSKPAVHTIRCHVFALGTQNATAFSRSAR